MALARSRSLVLQRTGSLFSETQQVPVCSTNKPLVEHLLVDSLKSHEYTGPLSNPGKKEGGLQGHKVATESTGTDTITSGATSGGQCLRAMKTIGCAS